MKGKGSLTIHQCKALWDSYSRQMRRMEKAFHEISCVYRQKLTPQEMGSTFLNITTCISKNHPNAKTPFICKCAIELCPLKSGSA